MITLPDVAPGVGLIIHGAAGPAGGAGPPPAGGPYDAVSEATAAFAGNGDARSQTSAFTLPELVPPADLASADAAPARERQRPGGPTNALEMALLFLIGMLFMLVSSLFRRRYRRRLGWGMLPERSLLGLD